MVGVQSVREDCNLILVTAGGQIIRMNTGTIRTAGRATMGVKLIDLETDDQVTSFTLLGAEEENGSDETGDDQ